MRFMNNYEIDDACRRYADHPLLGPATRTLRNLRDAANANSDGWAYWPKPTRAAEKLMALIEGDDHPGGRHEAHFDDEREDVTREKLAGAYRSIKAFRTREKIEFEILEPPPVGQRLVTYRIDEQEARVTEFSYDVRVPEGTDPDDIENYLDREHDEVHRETVRTNREITNVEEA